MSTAAQQMSVGAMSAILSDLRSTYSKALARISTSGGAAYVSESVRSAFSSSITKAIGVLERQQAEVINGTRTFANWAAYAQSVHQDIAYHLGEVGNWNLSGLISNTISATVKDVADGATAIAKGAFPVLGLVVAGLVAIAVIRLS